LSGAILILSRWDKSDGLRGRGNSLGTYKIGEIMVARILPRLVVEKASAFSLQKIGEPAIERARPFDF